MLASFELTGWYAWLLYAAGAYLFWTAVFEKGREHLHWISQRLHRGGQQPVPQVASTPEPPTSPLVRIGNPGGSLSTVPLSELEEGEHTYLVRVEPSYGIWNDDPQTAIRDVVSGARTRDAREHIFESYFAQYIGPGGNDLVHDVGSLPREWLRDVPQHAAFAHFLYWAHFSHNGSRWEIVHDPQTNADWFTQIDLPQPGLDIRLENRGGSQRILNLTNVGNVDLRNVECVLPPNIDNWQMTTDVLPTYPVGSLAVGDALRIPIVVTLGGPAAIELLARAWSEAGPYERRITVSVYD